MRDWDWDTGRAFLIRFAATHRTIRYNTPMYLRILLLLLLTPLTGFAGVYYSAEEAGVLPSAWRGFLVEVRQLKLVGQSGVDVPALPLRDDYREAVENLLKKQKDKPLDATEWADLGALYIRLNQPRKAIETLNAARKVYPDDFKITANLGTAWQLEGDYAQASRVLQEAVRKAPDRFKRAEEYQLKLVQLRQKDGKTIESFDDLFGIAFTSEKGEIKAGQIDPLQRKKLPNDAPEIVQQLLLWFPQDGRLLWLLAEVANARGDTRTAASVLEGVVESGITCKDARERRRVYRAESDRIAKLPDDEHAKYRGDIEFRCTKPYTRALDVAKLPEIRPEGINSLPWLVVNETVIGRPFRPKMHKHLSQLDGKTVSMVGYMQPLTLDTEVGAFLLVEYPVGCWFCETPDPASILLVNLKAGKLATIQKGQVKIVGKLKLNTTDPEEFLYTLTDAKVIDPD